MLSNVRARHRYVFQPNARIFHLTHLYISYYVPDDIGFWGCDRSSLVKRFQQLELRDRNSNLLR
jgi:hypothetical protein